MQLSSSCSPTPLNVLAESPPRERFELRDTDRALMLALDLFLTCALALWYPLSSPVIRTLHVLFATTWPGRIWRDRGS